MDAYTSSLAFKNPTMTASPSSPFLSPQSVADAPATINMQDLQRSTPLPDDDALSSSSSPAPAASHSNNKKEPKKRKSWGQVLPEPKTNLPPRKRAKTADEKEQRRIERVKRNRLAAHNSRERKREEMDRLTAERDHFRDTFRRVFSQLKQLESQNEWYRARATEKLPELPNMSANIEKDNFLLSAINGTPAPELPFSAPTPGPTSTPAYVEDTSSIKRETSVSSTTMNPREASFSSPAVNSMDSFAMSSLDSLDPFGTNCREGSYASPTSLDDGSYDSPINTASQPATPRDELSVGFQQFGLEGAGKSLDFNFSDFLAVPNQPHVYDDISFGFGINDLIADPQEDNFFQAAFSNDNMGTLGSYEPSGKSYDLQTDSGATSSVSDGSGIAA